MKTYQKSQELLSRALFVTPVGSQTYSKSYRYIAGKDTPYFMDYGKGSHVWDIDGNEFIDFILGLGPITIGYNNQEINETIIKQLEKGITFSQATNLEVELAEKLIEIIPCAEMVRFLKNGSDATTAAVRLARAYTGRDMIAVSGYHGMHDWYIGSTALNSGVPEAIRELTISFTYNEVESLERIFDKHTGKIAAVIMEPVQDNGPNEHYLEKIRSLCDHHDAQLIFDEIVSGFRYSLGGAQEYFDVTPDMSAIGKGMANGMPISALVGKSELLKQIEDSVFISTTFGGETLSLAAALKTIEILERPESFLKIWRLSERLQKKSISLAEKKGLNNVVTMWGLAPHCGFTFKEIADISPNEMLSVYQQHLLKNGILSVGINNFCLEHTEDDIDCHIKAIDSALDDLVIVVESGNLGMVIGEDKKISPIFKRN